MWASRRIGQVTQQNLGFAPVFAYRAYEDPSNQYGNAWYDYGHHETVWTDGRGSFVGGDLSFDPNQTPTDRTWTRARPA